MNKQQALEKVKIMERELNKLRAIIDKPDVKPLFPTKAQGAIYTINSIGDIDTISLYSPDSFIVKHSQQGRTFYSQEEAEAFAKRETARAYCLERINEVNEGDNGFKCREDNFTVNYDHNSKSIDVGLSHSIQDKEPSEYIRTADAAEQLINNPEFVNQWKIWKLGENNER